MLFLIVATVRLRVDSNVPMPEVSHINGEDYQIDVEFAVDGTVIEIYLNRLDKKRGLRGTNQ